MGNAYCLNCGTAFEGKRANAVYCSSSCRVGYHKKKDRTIKVSPGNPSVTLHNCEFSEKQSAYLNYFDAIITDPMYFRVSLDDYRALGSFAADCLVPGGTLAVLTGNGIVFDVWEILKQFQELEYISQYCYAMPNSSMKSQKYSSTGRITLTQKWKPILRFQKKGMPKNRQRVGSIDFLESKHKDKDEGLTTEERQIKQSIGGMVSLVATFSEPSSKICDPFLGMGTIGQACQFLQRREFVGFEVKTDRFSKAKAVLLP